VFLFLSFRFYLRLCSLCLPLPLGVCDTAYSVIIAWSHLFQCDWGQKGLFLCLDCFSYLFFLSFVLCIGLMFSFWFWNRTCCGVECYGGFHIQRFSCLFIFLRGDLTWDLQSFDYLLLLALPLIFFLLSFISRFSLTNSEGF